MEISGKESSCRVSVTTELSTRVTFTGVDFTGCRSVPHREAHAAKASETEAARALTTGLLFPPVNMILLW